MFLGFMRKRAKNKKKNTELFKIFCYVADAYGHEQQFHMGYVQATEYEVETLVQELNAKRDSCWPKVITEVDGDLVWDERADYISYRRVKVGTFDDIRNNWHSQRSGYRY